mgnify:FL=1
MGQNNKGFTLIELLVVVAIIGILAAVGTVAYQGYISGANKSATKSNHASAVKYLAAEIAKCSIGETEVMKTTTGTSFDCDSRDDGSNAIATHAVNALSDFKNSFEADQAGVAVGTAEVLGQVNISDDGDNITVVTCWEKDCASSAISTNVIAIE